MSIGINAGVGNRKLAPLALDQFMSDLIRLALCGPACLPTRASIKYNANCAILYILGFLEGQPGQNRVIYLYLFFLNF